MLGYGVRTQRCQGHRRCKTGTADANVLKRNKKTFREERPPTSQRGLPLISFGGGCRPGALSRPVLAREVLFALHFDEATCGALKLECDTITSIEIHRWRCR